MGDGTKLAANQHTIAFLWHANYHYWWTGLLVHYTIRSTGTELEFGSDRISHKQRGLGVIWL